MRTGTASGPSEKYAALGETPAVLAGWSGQ
jgi:hypothetical protein